MSAGGKRRSQRRTAPPTSRRAWGWHPLQPEWADRVVDAAGVGDRTVVEVGAGAGALTAPLVRRGVRVIAVELHPGRAAKLRDRFATDDVTVVRADLTALRWPRRPFHVVASPPYNLTTELVRRLLSLPQLHAADLVLQRAAATRLADRPPGKLAHSYALDVGMSVPRRAFDPPPKVDSVVLRIRRR
ncbi:MAG: methyltransferase domain-containing protein [Actinomycetia bacterium]|nr:methyltransferase domain-containing protein [Actinomycetes bacterium]